MKNPHPLAPSPLRREGVQCARKVCATDIGFDQVRIVKSTVCEKDPPLRGSWTCFEGWMGYDLRHFREVIEQMGAHPATIAKVIGCSRGTVYAYLRKYPELKAAFEAKRGAAVADQAQFSKEAFEKAIRDSYGVKAAVAAAVGCSRQTVDNALERWPELRELLDAARSGLVAKASSALAADVENAASDGHQRAYMFVLKTLGKDEGFVERSEVTGADGAGLFDLSPEVVKLVEEMGLDVSEVARQFESMVRAAAAEKKAG